MRTLGIGLLGLALAGCSTTALPSGDESQQQALIGCSERRMYVRHGSRVVEYDAVGNARERFVFGTAQGAPREVSGLSSWQAIGEWLAASAYLASPGNTSDTEIVLLGRDGVALQTIVTGGQPQLYPGADGSLAVAASRNFLRRADGTIVELGEYQPLGPLLSDGSLPASLGPYYEETSPKGRLRPTGAPTAWQFDVFQDAVPAYGDARGTSRQFVYLSYDATTTSRSRLIAIRPGGVVRVEVSGQPSLVHVAGDRWVLLADQASATLSLVDLTTSEVTRIEATLPFFNYNLTSATVDESGRVFTSVQRDEELQLVRSDDGGKTFVDVGAPMPRGEELGFPPSLAPIAHRGSALALNLSTGYGNMLNSVQFTADRTHTVMPGGGYYLNYSPLRAEADLTTDGQCAASWVLSDGDPFGATASYSLVVFDHDGPRVITTASDAYPAISFAN